MPGVPQYLLMQHSLVLATLAVLGRSHNLLCPASQAALKADPRRFTYPRDILQKDPLTAKEEQDLIDCEVRDIWQDERVSSWNVTTRTYTTEALPRLYHPEGGRRPHKCSDHFECPIEDRYVDLFTSRQVWRPSISICQHDQYARSGDRINVVVMGGSVTSGRNSDGCWNIVSMKKEKCQWWKLVYAYLRERYHNNIRLFDFSSGQESSALGATNLKSRLLSNNLTISGSTIIFIDYSMNDLDNSCEKLVRQILKLSQDSIPTIFIINTAFLGYAYYYKHPDRASPEAFLELNLARDNVNQKIAEYYGLYFWSLIPLAFSGVIAERSPVFADYVKNRLDFCDSRSHPWSYGVHFPWVVHEFIGDLIASAFEREYLYVNKRGFRCENVRKSILTNVIPPALTYDDTSYGCKQGVPDILDIAFYEKFIPVGWKNFLMTPNSSWVHTDEGRERYGLVSELNEETLEKESVLTIPLKVLSLEAPTEELMLEIQYMRTYLNAGVAVVYFCGKLIGQYDALWDNDYTSSETDLTILPLNFCLNSKPQDRNLVIVHAPVPLSSRNPSGKFRTSKQKFKLLAVRICRAYSSVTMPNRK